MSEAKEVVVRCAATEPRLIPERRHADDAGADLRLAERAVIRPGEARLYGTGARVAIPDGFFGLIALRSSMYDKGIAIPTSVGIIDPGYRGELKIPLVSTDGEMHDIPAGERIAQLVILPYAAAVFEPSDDLGETERGGGGFGSTGRG